MSEYQYYEFQAIDRGLSEDDRKALRALSSRARITTTSFTNSYDWGDFRGDPAKLMERWFDLHLYLANWGSRRLMMRLPQRLIAKSTVDVFVREVEGVAFTVCGENLILDISRDEVEVWDDGSGWLAALAPLRADVLAGDLRFFYLLWLIAVEQDAFEDDALEPMPGVGPLTGALGALAEFFDIDADLVEAAGERGAGSAAGAISSQVARSIIEAMGEAEKTAMLSRLFDGDPYAAVELRGKVRERVGRSPAAAQAGARTVGELRRRAEAIRSAREAAEAERAEAERKRIAAEAEAVRSARLTAIRRRGDGVWREVETEIERRSAGGYDKAALLLAELRAVAEEQDALDGFLRRLDAIRQQHVRKASLIERLRELG